MKYLLLLVTFLNLFAHPINLTKMDFNLTNKIFHLRFISFNMEKSLHKTYNDEKEIKNDASMIFKYTKQHLKIYSNDKQCLLIPQKIIVSNEIIIDEFLKVQCPEYNKFKIFFDMFFREDPTQTGILKIYNSEKEYVVNFDVNNFQKEVEITKKVSFYEFLKMGIIHILEGIDHITFLLMLLLPAIKYNYKMKNSLKDILIIATAFTISHSVSLILSAFEIVTPPPKLIEILIAVTIFLTALNNLFHFVNYKKEWLIAFLFGFIHGFAFSEALRGLNVNLSNFIKMVVGFNLGVEIGQFIVIVTVLPLLYFGIKKISGIYQVFSIFGAFLAVLWFIDRVFALNFMPF